MVAGALAVAVWLAAGRPVPAGTTAGGAPVAESGDQGDAAARYLEAARRAQAAGETKAALELYDAVLNLRGDDPEVRQQRALIRMADGQYPEARQEAQRAVDLAPRRGRYRITLAIAWSRGPNPDFKAARSILKKAIQLLEGDRDRLGQANAWFVLGKIEEEQAHNFETARDDYRTALEYNPADDRIRAALNRLAPAEAEPR